MSTAQDSKPAFLQRMMLGLLGRFGLRWVSRREVAIVLKGEQFHKMVGGATTFFVVPGLQRVAQVLTIGPDYLDIPLRELSTGDGLLVGIDTLIEYKFDPRMAPAENDAQRARLARRCATQAERRVLLGFLAQRAMQSVTAQYRAEQICRGQVWDTLEQRFFEMLDKRLLPFGMQLDRLGCALQRAHPPEILKQRFEMAAQRSINIDDLDQYTPYQITQALRSEAIEALKGMQGASPYLNLHDVTSTEEAAEKPRQIIDSNSRPSEPKLTDEQAPKKPKGRSRLDPD
jgi:regulator of protease activity HflC (stomatin/prohibitin superfamily)